MAGKQLDLQSVVPSAELSDLVVEIKSNEHPEDRAVRLKIQEAKAELEKEAAERAERERTEAEARIAARREEEARTGR